MTVFSDPGDDDIHTVVSDRVARRKISDHFKRMERGEDVGPDLDRFESFPLRDDAGSVVVYDPKDADSWVSGLPEDVER